MKDETKKDLLFGDTIRVRVDDSNGEYCKDKYAHVARQDEDLKDLGRNLFGMACLIALAFGIVLLGVFLLGILLSVFGLGPYA